MGTNAACAESRGCQMHTGRCPHIHQEHDACGMQSQPARCSCGSAALLQCLYIKQTLYRRLQDTQCVQVICRNTQSHTHAHTFIPRCAAASARHSRCSKLLKAQLAQCCGNARTTCWLSGAVYSQPCMHVHALLQLDATLAAHSSPSSTA